MEEILKQFCAELPWYWLAGLIVVCIAVLGKGADWLVEEAVVLSERSGIPKLVIGATIVSLGTTTPEAAVSVFAALTGEPDLAMANAVGSIICDTGLVLGVACLIAPLPIHRRIINRQTWQKVLTGFLLIFACWPWTQPLGAFQDGGQLPQWMGFIFLILLAWYLWDSIISAKKGRSQIELEDFEADASASTAWVIGKLLLGLGLVIVSSRVLIPGVREGALRIDVPESVVGATLVAFGTSLPELITAVTAARRGHGDLAIGNVIGADILNVLFVAGLSSSVTAGGLEVPANFFWLYFPSMMFLLIVFRLGVSYSKDSLKRPFGILMLVTYAIVTVLGYILK